MSDKKPKLPLPLAINIAAAVSLLSDPNEVSNQFLLDNDKLVRRLADFQMLAMVETPYKDCLVAYDGVTLNRDHIKALKTIHKSTPQWVKAYAAGVLTENLQFAVGKDATEITKLLYQLMS